VDGPAGDLADEIVQGDVEGAFRSPVVGDHAVHRRAGRQEPGRSGVGLADRGKEERKDAVIVSTVSP